MSNPRPCSPAEAVARALRWVGSPIIYWLSGGDYHAATDDPSTPAPQGARAPNGVDVSGKPCSDCRYAINHSYKLPAHRPGFNHGAWATVSDDLNYNSAIEDSEHAQDLFVPVTNAPQLGDIVTYPTIMLRDHATGDWIRNPDGSIKKWIGHGSIVVGVDRAAGFDLSAPKFALLDIVHCHGPAGVGPAITRSDGSVFDIHSERWPLAEHCSRLIRLKP